MSVFSPVGPGLKQGRVDQGVDWSGSGPVFAVGNGTILSTSNPGWPGGAFIALKLDNPPDASHSVVYYAEDITAQVHPGQHVSGGEQIGQATGGSSGIEIGWGNPGAIGQALAGALNEFHGSNATAEGTNFLNYVKGGGPGILGDIENAVGDIAGAVPGVSEAIALEKTVETAAKKLTDPAFWERVGVFSLGTAVAVIGLVLLVSTSKTGQKAISEGAEVAPIAAMAAA